jgi:hypothetical protein
MRHSLDGLDIAGFERRGYLRGRPYRLSWSWGVMATMQVAPARDGLACASV